MKKITADQQDDLAKAEGKGKQTLVLFLFGGLVLLLPLLAKPVPPMTSSYAVGKHAGMPQWQVYRLDATYGTGRQGSVPFARSKADSWLVVDNTQDQNTFFPPALALFFHRPMAVNSCTPDELTLLPGIGPHLAQAMVATRDKRGPFTAPEDLLQVPGIGPAHLQRLLPLVRFQ